MPTADFVHLHLHTEYSLLDAACRIERMMDKAVALNFPAVAMTDHGVMYGAVEFYQAAKKRNLKPIIGCEVYVAPGSRLDKKPGSGMRDVYHHLVLLARNDQGYKNLIRLVTAANLEGFYYKPRIDKEILEKYSEGLIGLSGCLASEIPEAIMKDDLARARQSIDWFKQVLGPDHFYLELQNHGIPEQNKVNRQLIPWAKEFGVKLVATNDVHYVEEGHWQAHDCLVCIGRQQQRDAGKPTYQPGQFYLRSAEEMKARFAEVPEAVLNTLEVADQCNVAIQFGKGAQHYPVFQPPETWTREGYLRRLLCDGLKTRYGIIAHVEGSDIRIDALERADLLPPCANPEEQAGWPSDWERFGIETAAALHVILMRLELELRVIEKTGYVSYFLIVGDFIRHGRSKGISCVARGSAAGSLVTYLLEIANVDPLRYGLLFERFLNPERVSPPDIDIDFADDRRQEVIEYVRDKYGRDAVAQIITFGTMGAKAVIRDVGRVMGMSFGECDRLSKMVTDAKWSLSDALEKSTDFRKAYDSEEATRELVDYAQVLEDQARNSSVHAAGVVIGAQPLVNLLPLKQDEDGVIVTQYAMNPVGDLGLLKMDFLGLKTLTVIRNSCDLIERTQGIQVPIDHLPLDDAKTYELLNNAQTLGVFQLESGGMRDLCRKFQIASVEHITALISLYRPGPMDLIPDFIERRHGRAPIVYPHPRLEPIARETYGVLIYQEQVMQAAQILAGYTLGGADLLRRAMGKKKLEEMEKQRAIFVEGCGKNDIPPSEANPVFDLLEKFAGYGFNKSHAAAYAIVAYQTAYLKANYPVEFLCAMMTNDQGDLAKLAQYIGEARGFGIQVLGPDVNESEVGFAPAKAKEGNGSRVIRFGLAAIKGMGEVAVESVLQARRLGGRFTSLQELCERIDTRTVNRRALECLIKTGACDGLGPNRATLMAGVDGALSRANSMAADKAAGQSSLFDAFDAVPAKHPVKPVVLADWPMSEKLAYEKEMLGIFVSGHPLDPHAKLLERFVVHTVESLPGLPNRGVARIGGLVTALSEGVSKKNGKKYAMATIEDLTGSVQILAMNENYDKFRELLAPNTAVLVVGEVATGEDKPKIFPQEIMKLEDAPRKFTRQAHVWLKTIDSTRPAFENLRTLAEAHAGRVPLFLALRYSGGEVAYLETNERYSVNPGPLFETAVESAFGSGSLQLIVDRSLPERAPRKWEKRSGGGGDEE